MALLSVIRRWHFREGMPIREIERRTGQELSRAGAYIALQRLEKKELIAGRDAEGSPERGGRPRRSGSHWTGPQRDT